MMSDCGNQGLDLAAIKSAIQSEGAMRSLLQKLRAKAGLGGDSEQLGPPVLGSAVRFPYGPFQFKFQVVKGMPYEIEATTNLKSWVSIFIGTAAGEPEFLDSDASKVSYRFYRLNSNGLYSLKVIGYASITLAPGFSMVGNPLVGGNHGLQELFKEMPQGTSVSKFDSRLHQLRENILNDGKWTNPAERIGHGEGAIVFNPSSEYKSLTFVGEVRLGGFSIPFPAGFTIQTSSVPKPGPLHPHLRFPFADAAATHHSNRTHHN